MAYDKVIDSAALDADLTTVADAIRTAAGSSGNLTFPAGFVSALQNLKVQTVIKTVTFASDLGNGTNTIKAITTTDEFVKAHSQKDGFAVLMYPVTPVPMTEANVIHGIYHGNMNIGASDAKRQGFAYKSNSASSMGFDAITNPILGTNYNASFRARSTGSLDLYVASGRIVKAGTYKFILICWE